MNEYLIENKKVEAVIRQYFTIQAWKQIPHTLKTRYINMTKNHIEGNTIVNKF